MFTTNQPLLGAQQRGQAGSGEAEGAEGGDGLLGGLEFVEECDHAAGGDAQHGDLILQALDKDGVQVCQLAGVESVGVEAGLGGGTRFWAGTDGTGGHQPARRRQASPQAGRGPVFTAGHRIHR